MKTNGLAFLGMQKSAQSSEKKDLNMKMAEMENTQGEKAGIGERPTQWKNRIEVHGVLIHFVGIIRMRP
jgi:hypothetical protein